jgi:hypothetical protein
MQVAFKPLTVAMRERIGIKTCNLMFIAFFYFWLIREKWLFEKSSLIIGKLF